MKTALIFAAGRGMRLRPITDTRPKALCEVHKKPLIDYHLEKLNDKALGIQEVVINHAYLGDQIKRHVNPEKYPNLKISYFAEPPGGYETGGTIRLLHHRLSPSNEPFIVINADIYTDYDLKQLKLPEKSLAHLVLVKPTALNNRPDFGLTESKHLSNQSCDYLFSGIACYRAELFKNRTGHRTSISPWLKDAAEQSHATGELYEGIWFDIGSPERLREANQPTQA